MKLEIDGQFTVRNIVCSDTTKGYHEISFYLQKVMYNVTSSVAKLSFLKQMFLFSSLETVFRTVYKTNRTKQAIHRNLCLGFLTVSFLTSTYQKTSHYSYVIQLKLNWVSYLPVSPPL